jgi:RNA polymerase sigma factor (TIGR02999 family)
MPAVPSNIDPLKSPAIPPPQHEVTRVLAAVGKGDAKAAEHLLDLLYDELRGLAQARMAREPGGGAGMTLQATALVHEAYLRVIKPPADEPDRQQKWDSRGHFFGAAALAMRRILVERARHQKRLKHGGARDRVELDEQLAPAAPEGESVTDLIALDEALTKLETLDARKAKVVSLRFFAGLSIDETAAALDVSPATVKNEWTFARAWLHRELSGG